MTPPGKSILIRTALPADLPAILSLHKLEREALGHLPSTAFKKRLAAGHLAVAVDGKSVVAYLLTYSPLRPGKTHDCIHHVCVAPSHRRRRIASELLRTAVAAGRQNGRTWLTAWCRITLPANRFWEATGAIPTHIRPGGVQRHVPILLWQLPLSPPIPPAKLIPVEPHRAGSRSANRSDIHHVNARTLLAYDILRPGKSCLDTRQIEPLANPRPR